MTTKELELKNKKEMETKSENTYQCKVYIPEVDIYENRDEIVLEADIPGVQKKDVNISLEDNVLRIDAKIRPEEYQGLRPLYGEYNIGHFQREFTIGETVEQDKIAAQVNNGVLKITIPKSERARSRQIAVS
jgi:HSP20 family protein